VRVAAAVEVLVVVEHARDDRLERADPTEDLGADGRMELDRVAIGRCEPFDLEEDRVGDGDLAQVVQQRAGVGNLDRLRRPAQLGRQRAGVGRDPLGVPGGVGIAQIEHPREGCQRVDEGRLRLAPAALQLARRTDRQRQQRGEDDQDRAAGRRDDDPPLATRAGDHLTAREHDGDDVGAAAVGRRQRRVDGADPPAVDREPVFGVQRAAHRRDVARRPREERLAAVVVQAHAGDVADDVAGAHRRGELALAHGTVLEPIDQRAEDRLDARQRVERLIGLDRAPVSSIEDEREQDRRQGRAREEHQREAGEEARPSSHRADQLTKLDGYEVSPSAWASSATWVVSTPRIEAAACASARLLNSGTTER
jgi:hypothetical protein